MPRIPEDLIEQVRTATDIVEIVGEHVQLTRRGGANYFGLCPFHKEDTPSFSVNTERQIYHCFGCGAGGNVFRFVQEVDRVGFVEAVTFLAERVGIRLPDRDTSPAAQSENDPIYQANDLARKYFHHLLTKDSRGREALAYLRGRGLGDATLVAFGLGYAPAAWDGLVEVARKRGLNPQILEKAGLALPRRTGSGHYDRFRDRVTFPIANLSGRTIAFGARALQADQEPKYLNSPETPIYRKGTVLYGLDRARETIRRQGRAVVVEGYMDLLSLVQAGVNHTVASAGTALTEDQCRTVGRYAREVVLVFDGDAAGSLAAVRGAEAVLAAGLDARVVTLPAEHDPDSFVREHGEPAFSALLDQADPVLAFLVGRLQREHDLATAAGKARALEAVKPLLLRSPDPLRRDLLLQEAAQRLGVDEAAVRQALQQEARQARSQARTSPGPAREPQADPPTRELAFLGILLNYPRLIAPTARSLPPEALSDPRCQVLARILLAQGGDTARLDPARLMTEIDDPTTVQLISRCAMQGLDPDQVDAQWQDYLRHFQRESLTKRIEEARETQRRAAAAGDESEAARAGSEIDRLVRERQALAPEQSP